MPRPERSPQDPEKVILRDVLQPRCDTDLQGAPAGPTGTRAGPSGASGRLPPRPWVVRYPMCTIFDSMLSGALGP